MYDWPSTWIVPILVSSLKLPESVSRRPEFVKSDQISGQQEENNMADEMYSAFPLSQTKILPLNLGAIHTNIKENSTELFRNWTMTRISRIKMCESKNIMTLIKIRKVKKTVQSLYEIKSTLKKTFSEKVYSRTYQRIEPLTFQIIRSFGECLVYFLTACRSRAESTLRMENVMRKMFIIEKLKFKCPSDVATEVAPLQNKIKNMKIKESGIIAALHLAACEPYLGHFETLHFIGGNVIIIL